MKLIATDGYSYTNGDIYSKDIDLGINDSPDNWYLVRDEDIKEEEEEW